VTGGRIPGLALLTLLTVFAARTARKR
jgi:hypothetical protein